LGGHVCAKGTPTNIIDKLANNLDAALEEPAVKNRLADLGVSSQKGGAFFRKIRQLCQI
jgi:tripartite-type tricarboxylate transporter receptor subunit TctC